MNVMAILIGLVPVIGWGIFPACSLKLGGDPRSQTLGVTLGTLLTAIVISLLFGVSLPTGQVLLFGFLSGAGWCFGQIMLFKTYELVGTSEALPIHSGIQLIVNTLWGVIFLGNWAGVDAKIMGFSALFVIIIGIYLTVWEQHQQKSSKHNVHLAIIFQIIGAAGYWLYSAAPRFINLSGIDAMLPQGIGMVVIAVIYGIISLPKENVFTQKVSYLQIFPGIVFALASLAYFVASQPNMLGLSTAYIMSQAYVVVSTLIGIFYLHEHKTNKEFIATMIGLALIITAAIITVFIPK